MKPLAPERVALLKAADIIERDGWCQRIDLDAAGRRCMMGAIAEAMDGSHRDEIRKVGEIVEKFLGLLAPADGGIYPAARWNDAPGRTQAEVVSALRAAAVHGL